MTVNPDVAARIEPWGPDDLPLLQQVMGDPAMTEHLGGPESPEAISHRHDRYVRLPESGTGRMFAVVDGVTGEAAGTVGYWEKEWRGVVVYETGWSIVPRFQGRGLAVAATRLALDRAREERKHRFVHAFPSVANGPSNAICRKLGFELLEVCDFEYPPGNPLRCNDWRFDLAEPTA